MVTAALAINTSLLGWLVTRQMATEDRLAKIETMMAEKVRTAERDHATFVTRDQMDLALERTLSRVEERLRDLYDQLGIRYRGPVNPPENR